IVGYASMNIDGDTGDVAAFFIAADKKGLGLGRRLWNRLEVHAKDRCVTRLRVESDPQAVPFYRAMGCRQIGDVPSGSIAGRMLPLLEKRLA
ncbi:MAG TPA: GNAT family N-acetyltransferase, partial [Rhodobacteraceae bacterium]|nr:GNAT family N-acetyltransferase [Paracoccaceae bacterium]